MKDAKEGASAQARPVWLIEITDGSKGATYHWDQQERTRADLAGKPFGIWPAKSGFAVIGLDSVYGGMDWREKLDAFVAKHGEPLAVLPSKSHGPDKPWKLHLYYNEPSCGTPLGNKTNFRFGGLVFDVRHANGYVACNYQFNKLDELLALPAGGHAFPAAVVDAMKRPLSVVPDARPLPGDGPEWTLDEARDALGHISPEGRDEWMKAGTALKTEFGNAGWHVWREWAMRSPKWAGDARERSQWDSFTADSVHMGWIVNAAKTGGFRRWGRGRRTLEAGGFNGGPAPVAHGNAEPDPAVAVHPSEAKRLASVSEVEAKQMVRDVFASDFNTLAEAYLNLPGKAENVLAVTEPSGDFGTAYIAEEGTGRWLDSVTRWDKELRDVITSQKQLAAAAVGGEDDKAALKLMGGLSAIQKKKHGERTGEFRIAVSLAVQERRIAGAADFANVCCATELDADMSVLGCKNGVVSLADGKVLPEADARLRYVTKSTGLDYDPAARHADVGKLFAHLDAGLRGWWEQAVGRTVWGQPNRKFVVVHGAPGGGKTTWAQAMLGALGNDYARQANANTLQLNRAGASAHTAGREDFQRPVRFAYIDEMPTMALDIPFMKNVTTGGLMSMRQMHERKETVRASAVLFLIGNPESLPRFHAGAGTGMRARIVALDYPAIAEGDRDPGFGLRVMDDLGFRRAMLAWLVKMAVANNPLGYWKTEGWPELPGAVKDSTDEFAESQASDLDEFLLRLVRDPDGHLKPGDVWDAWMQYCGGDDGDNRYGGFTKTKFLASVRKAKNIPPAKLRSVNGSKVKGWVGWALLDAPDGPEPPDGGGGLRMEPGAAGAAVARMKARSDAAGLMYDDPWAKPGGAAAITGLDEVEARAMYKAIAELRARLPEEAAGAADAKGVLRAARVIIDRLRDEGADGAELLPYPSLSTCEGWL